MKLLSVVLLFVLFISGFAYSQDKEGFQKSPEDRARMVTDKLNKTLVFTGGQDSLVYKAELDFFNSLGVFNKDIQNRESDMSKVRDIAKNELYSKMKIILTPDQLDKYDDLQKQMDKQMDKKRDGQKGKHRNQ
jgi:hypothetical protein